MDITKSEKLKSAYLRKLSAVYANAHTEIVA
jgi:hypothetical protein